MEAADVTLNQRPNLHTRQWTSQESTNLLIKNVQQKSPYPKFYYLLWQKKEFYNDSVWVILRVPQTSAKYLLPLQHIHHDRERRSPAF